MTYAQIKQLALRQMDEDPHDMDEYGDLLGTYINEGYQAALMDYAKPREEYILATDENGDTDVSDKRIISIHEVTEYPKGGNAWATLDALGDKLNTAVRKGKVRVVAFVTYPEMVEDSEEPKLPNWAHGALADYACYRYLCNGNMAKQSRAQFYLQSYHQTMNRIRPQGMGSVKRTRNLYEATSATYTRW